MSFTPETPELYSLPADRAAQERLAGMLAGRILDYMGRISTRAAEQMARSGDQLEPGQIVIDLSKVNLPDIFDMPESLQVVPADISINALSDELYIYRDVNDEDEWEALETDNNKALDRYGDKLYSAVRVADTITEIMQTPAAEDRQTVENTQTDAYDRKAIVRAYVEAYMQANPDAEFDPDYPNSLKHVGQFINYYREEILREYQLMNIGDKLTGFRNELAASLDTPALARLIGREAAARLKSHVRNQPLIVADPLTVYMKRGEDTTDYLGWFEPESRHCYIDPLSIDKQADRLKLDSAGRDARILQTMAHELIHAATNDVHRIWRSNSQPTYKPSGYIAHSLWPKFFYEGMTEKLAYAWAYKTRPDLFRGRSYSAEAAYEVNLRTYFSDNPAETLAPRSVQRARAKQPSSYAVYRLMIDTIMDKADWAAVGLDRHKADKLAIAAFLERPDDTVRRTWPKRKAFMQALHGASQPGIMNTVRYITEHYGPYAALDVLESPDFDIKHDKLKQLISEVHNRSLSIAQRQLAEQISRLNRPQDLNVPKAIIEPIRKLVSQAAQVVELKQPLKRAELAYFADLRLRYGTRRREFTIEERLMRSVLGTAAVTASRHRKVNYRNIDEHYRDLQQWQDGRQQRAKLLARQNNQDE